MSVYIKPVGQIKAKLGLNLNGPVQSFFTASCYRHMDKYVPMDKGDLRINVALLSDEIVYESPYAKYQYKGIREDGTHEVKNYTTPGTGPYWDERMVSAEINDVVKEVEDYIKYHGGSY